uniref:protein kinase APK1A, chloroplastic-like isoform X1 n=1 Tax=Fragaria vesca subsp. vesca TaxID=101020 RepID=UPI0005CAB507|nr:PREDICTED: protein kinase APK1A, chloroplastic-like isoform X1 [Fragaria vesca subsp. vesca]XP_011459298.1 PREDICTED: protein kinase APK1A, chloroplastic-like isoform X1 [Fragaria vesca subsp. vesca]
MRLFWWQQLPLLILIQILQPSRTSYKIYAEALLTFNSRVESPELSSGQTGKYPCLKQWTLLKYYKLQDPCVVSLSKFPGISSIPLRPSRVSLAPFAPRHFVTQSSINVQKEIHKPRNRRIAHIVDGDRSVPTLTPVQAAGDKKPKKKVAAIIGGVAAALLVVIVVILVYIYLMRVKRVVRRTSDTSSSTPSPHVEWTRGDTSPYAVALSPYDTHNLRQLTILELEQATSNFNENNIIGQGRFGLVYKGLLQDGTIVAIKRRLHAPTQYFFQEVKHIARVNHVHILRLIGYCQDSSQQLLVYDYLPNGNVGNHLYDAEGLPIGKLNLRQRLSVALGAAKGLAHLHSLVPPLLHMNFRTSNVLLDDNFTAKVSDYGLTRLLNKAPYTGSSSAIDCFLDPELDSLNKFSERGDVYSFGVFLLELISGCEANGRYQLNSGDNLVLQAKDCEDLERFVDKTLGEYSMQAATKQMMELALMCIDASEQRPHMKIVVQELERIQARETSHFQIEVDEEIGAVTLGSELFK